MNASTLQQTIPAQPVWRMPIRPERYDRSPLSDAERMALEVLVSGDARLNSPARRKPEATLVRLTRPLHEVYGLRRTDASTGPAATRVKFGQMHRRGKSFWQWTAQEWCDVVGVTAESFEAANGLPRRREGLRPHLLDVAYLLCGFEQFGPIWTATAAIVASVINGSGGRRASLRGPVPAMNRWSPTSTPDTPSASSCRTRSRRSANGPPR